MSLLRFDFFNEIGVEHNVQAEYAREQSVYREKYEDRSERILQAPLSLQQDVIESDDTFEAFAPMVLLLLLRAFPRHRHGGIAPPEQGSQQFVSPFKSNKQIRHAILHVTDDERVDDLFTDFARPKQHVRKLLHFFVEHCLENEQKDQIHRKQIEFDPKCPIDVFVRDRCFDPSAEADVERVQHIEELGVGLTTQSAQNYQEYTGVGVAQ